jgi:hypothetical protein
MVLPSGIEPPTSSLPMTCSTTELRQLIGGENYNKKTSLSRPVILKEKSFNFGALWSRDKRERVFNQLFLVHQAPKHADNIILC